MKQLELTAGNLKAGMQAAGAKSADLWNVPLDELETMPGFNARDSTKPEYKAAVRAFADSIKANGFYRDQPLGVFVEAVKGKTKVLVFQGHRRLAAARLAVEEGCEKLRNPKTGRNEVPCISQPIGTGLDDLTVKLITSNSGQPLTMIETAEVVRRLSVEFNWEVKDIAEKLGMTTQTVNSHLTLAGAPVSVKKMVKSGEVSGSNAVKAIRQKGSDASKTLTEGVAAAAARGKTRATAKDLAPAKAAGGELAKAVLSLDADHPTWAQAGDGPTEFTTGWAAIVKLARGEA